MKLGVIARDDSSGLGHQSLEVVRNLDPHVVIVIDAGPRRRAPKRPDWHPDAERLPWKPDWTVPKLYDAFKTCDVVWSAETFYDPHVTRKWEADGIGTVLHVNPELYDSKHGSHYATSLWTPTGWWVDNVPGSRVMPLGYPVDRYPAPSLDEPYRIVHPTAYAMADRNGTQTMRRVETKLGRHGWTVDYVGPGAREVKDYWERDPGAAVSVIPRRYGGQCLSAMEALAAGVPVVMPDCSPNSEWPSVLIPAKHTGHLSTKGGRCKIYDVTPDSLHRTIVQLLNDPDRLQAEREKARMFAELHSWDMMVPRWWEALEKARLH